MEKNYEITMHVPLGERHGNLFLSEKNGTVNGHLCVFGKDTPLTGSLDTDGEIQLNGEISFLFGIFAYTATGKINEHSIELNASGGRYKFTITGREKETEENNNELH